MLVLTRKKNEKIDIGDNIVITVIEIRGDRIRLGIDAPENVSIARREVTLREQAKNNPNLLNMRDLARRRKK